MVTLVYGHAARVAAFVDALVGPPAPLLVDGDAAFPVPWGGVRELLASLRAQKGEAAFQAALAPHRGALSLVLRGLDGELDEAERRARDAAAGRRLGFLSHHGAIQRPLVAALAGAVESLLAVEPVCIVLRDALAVDAGSLTVLRLVERRASDRRRLRLVVALDPERAPPQTDVLTRNATLVGAHVAFLQAMAETEVHHLGGGDAATAPVARPAGAPQKPAPPDDDLERRAWRAIADAGPDDHAIRDLARDAARAAFRCFGFGATLRIGLALLERFPSTPDAAELHLLVALSAYNQQVETAGDPRLAEFLEAHLLAALDGVTDPADASHLRYRLCINSGRRKGDLDAGVRHGELAVAAARDPQLASSLSAYLEAWARNGLAYVLGRQRRLDEAAREIELGLSRLAAIGGGGGEEVGENEQVYSRLVLVDNRAQLAQLAGDDGVAARWQAELERLETELGVTSVAPHRWTRLHRRSGDLAAARRAALRGLGEAERLLDPFAEDRYAADLAELEYRLGDAAAACVACRRCLAVRRRAGAREDRVAAELSLAYAARRAGALDEADDALGSCLRLVGADEAALRAELLALRAQVWAQRGRRAEAEGAINEAIEEAVASGVGDVLVRVARTAGDVATATGQEEAAVEAYRRAIELAADCDEPAADAAAVVEGAASATHSPAGLDAGAARDRMGALLGLLDTGAGVAEPSLALRALELAPAALGDPDAWWDLPRLVRHLRALPTPPAGPALDAILAAARQRPDCSPFLDAWPDRRPMPR